MRIMKPKAIRKYIGYICLLIGFLFIFYGVLTYLDGPNETAPSKLECTDSRIIEIKPNSSVYHSFYCYPNHRYQTFYWTEAPSLILDRGIDASIKVEGDESIDAFLMNSTQADRGVDSHHLDFTGQVIELGVNKCDINFRPSCNDTSHKLVLANNQNKTIIVSINATEFTTVKVYNYDRAFDGLKLALVGGLILVVTFALGNPLGKLRYRMLFPIKFPGLDDYYARQKRREIPIEIILIGGVASILFILYLSYLSNLSRLPPQIVPIVLDWFVRISLFIFFILGILTITIFMITVGSLFNLFNNFILWVFVVKRDKYTINIKLEELTFLKIWKELVSPLSLLFWIITFVIAFCSYRYSTYLIFAIACMIPMVLIFGYNYSIALYKACKQLGLQYEQEFEESNFFISNTFISGVWAFVIFIIFWIKSTSIAVEPFVKTILAPSIPLTLNMPQLKETTLRTASLFSEFIPRGWAIYFTCCVLGVFACAILFFGLVILPIEVRKKRLRGYLMELSVFLLTFISIQIFSIISMGYLTFISLPISFAISFIAYNMKKFYSELVTS